MNPLNILAGVLASAAVAVFAYGKKDKIAEKSQPEKLEIEKEGEIIKKEEKNIDIVES